MRHDGVCITVAPENGRVARKRHGCIGAGVEVHLVQRKPRTECDDAGKRGWRRSGVALQRVRKRHRTALREAACKHAVRREAERVDFAPRETPQHADRLCEPRGILAHVGDVGDWEVVKVHPCGHAHAAVDRNGHRARGGQHDARAPQREPSKHVCPSVRRVPEPVQKHQRRRRRRAARHRVHLQNLHPVHLHAPHHRAQPTSPRLDPGLRSPLHARAQPRPRPKFRRRRRCRHHQYERHPPHPHPLSHALVHVRVRASPHRTLARARQKKEQPLRGEARAERR
mmetsp:Transcript_14950/g.40085  ORF Transcript_14950/g.40085 Transcript_14950/m.40085 type:complete len:284 (+) Transcript_14950:326-1177(+)